MIKVKMSGWHENMPIRLKWFNLEDGFSYKYDGRLRNKENDEIFKVRKICRRYTKFYKERRRWKYISPAMFEMLLNQFGYGVEGYSALPSPVPSFSVTYEHPLVESDRIPTYRNVYLPNVFVPPPRLSGKMDRADDFRVRRSVHWRVVTRAHLGCLIEALGGEMV